VKVILLGPQRRPTVNTVVRSLVLDGSLAADGPIATVTAGWLEREPDDGELSALLGGRAVNLGLYRRWLDVQERDPSFAAGERGLQAVLAELEDSYLLRLDYALQAVYALQRREPSEPSEPSESAGPGLATEGLGEAVAAVRELDAAHLRHVQEMRGAFFNRLRPDERPVIAEHRAAVADLLGGAAAMIVAGGHVGVLAGALHLFNVAAVLAAPVIAWSAGAMALTERIVLFHDRSPEGPGHPEVYGSGLSLVRGAVLLPHARARLRLDDTPRMAVFARRFAPARCILLDQGTRIDVAADGSWPPGARALAEDGRVTMLEAA
jgi:hypothetical protein